MGWAGPEEVRHKRKIYDAAREARSPGSIVGAVPNDHLAGMAPTCILPDGGLAREIGVSVDPALVVAARDAGATREELHARSYAGEFTPAEPLDLRLPRVPAA